MKPYRIYPSIIIGLMSALFLNGCFEHNQYQASKYKNIFMPQSQGKAKAVNKLVFIADSAQTLTYSAAYNGAGGPNTPGKDIAVEFNVKPALVDSFNTHNGTSYPILPKNSYELSRKKATIPANKLSTSNLDLKVHTQGLLQVSSKYLLPVTLSSSTGIEVNESKKTIYFLVSVKSLAIVHLPLAKNNPIEHSLFIKNKTKKIKFNAVADFVLPDIRSTNPIPIEFNVKSSLVDSFNIHNGSSYPMLPSNSYTFNKEAEIPAGKRMTDSLEISLNNKGSSLAGKKYILPVTIKTTDIFSTSKVGLNTDLKTNYFLIIPLPFPPVKKTYNFDNGTNEGWVFDNPDFTLKSDQSYSGEYSIGGTAKTSNGSWAHIEPSELDGGSQIYSLSFKYYEIVDQSGAGIRVLDSNGDMITAAATGNPNYNTYGANGYKKHGKPTSRDYEVWVEVRIVFDWIDGTAKITFTDTESDESETHSVTLAKNTNVRRLEIANYGRAGGGGFESGTNNIGVRLDDIELTMPLKQ